MVKVAGVMLRDVPRLRLLPIPMPPDPLAPPIDCGGGGGGKVVVVMVVVAAVWVTVVSLRFCLESEIITAVGLSLAGRGQSGKCR